MSDYIIHTIRLFALQFNPGPCGHLFSLPYLSDERRYKYGVRALNFFYGRKLDIFIDSDTKLFCILIIIYLI